jgi:type II secretory pathway pseudopilin PulG
MSPLSPSRSRRAAAGFTLVELGVVVLIIGLLATLALPAIKRVMFSARNAAVLNDFRVFAGAFQHYASDNGGAWPADQATGTAFPAGMANYLRTSGWGKATRFGGVYNWDYNQTHNGRTIKAAIAIYGTAGAPLTITAADLLAFDRKYDDGNLATGNIQQGYQGCVLYIIEN